MWVDSLLGILACLGLVLATNAVFVGDWPRFCASVAVCAGLGFWLLRRILADNAAQRLELADGGLPSDIEPDQSNPFPPASSEHSHGSNLEAAPRGRREAAEE